MWAGHLFPLNFISSNFSSSLSAKLWDSSGHPLKGVKLGHQGKTPSLWHVISLYFTLFILTFLSVYCVCYNSVVIHILIPSWGSLHTLYRNQFSHSRPPAATATSSQCLVAQDSYRGTADAHTLVLAQTLALRNILPVLETMKHVL